MSQVPAAGRDRDESARCKRGHGTSLFIIPTTAPCSAESNKRDSACTDEREGLSLLGFDAWTVTPTSMPPLKVLFDDSRICSSHHLPPWTGVVAIR